MKKWSKIPSHLRFSDPSERIPRHPDEKEELRGHLCREHLLGDWEADLHFIKDKGRRTLGWATNYAAESYPEEGSCPRARMAPGSMRRTAQIGIRHRM
ncbi:Adenylosuccinate Synthetase Isozyme 2 [Manis pentadactyla]|nr:Adenylosuccinate Synthetase Isozyme 2 [Manis pentadactyla]